ncbi:MAG TPA: hypothetical protein VH682_31630 [Gemmataceae bacterium]|jgi:hypothetical protein
MNQVVGETRKRTAMSWQACRLFLRYAAAGWNGWVFLAATLVSTGLGLLRPWPMKILVDHVLRRQPMAAPLAQGVQFLPGEGTSAGCSSGLAIELYRELCALANYRA